MGLWETQQGWVRGKVCWWYLSFSTSGANPNESWPLWTRLGPSGAISLGGKGQEQWQLFLRKGQNGS